MKNEANGPSSKRVRPGTEQLRARTTAVVDLPSAPQGTHRRQVCHVARPALPGELSPPRTMAIHLGPCLSTVRSLGPRGPRAWPKPGALHETDSGGGAPGPGRPPAPRRPPAGCGRSRIHSPTFVQHSGTSLGRQKTLPTPPRSRGGAHTPGPPPWDGVLPRTAGHPASTCTRGACLLPVAATPWSHACTPAPQPRQLRGLRPRPQVTASHAQTKEA